MRGTTAPPSSSSWRGAQSNIGTNRPSYKKCKNLSELISDILVVSAGFDTMENLPLR
jgi:hypothetical protein